MLTQELVKELFDYKDGVLIWKEATKTGLNRKGSVAGYSTSKGYVDVTVSGVGYKVHRLIFLMHHGYISKSIDHINGNKSDNRIDNLRACSNSENGCNAKISKLNKSGVKGVSWQKSVGKWRGEVMKNRKRVACKLFSSLQDAKEFCEIQREIHHGEFVRHK